MMTLESAGALNAQGHTVQVFDDPGGRRLSLLRQTAFWIALSALLSCLLAGHVLLARWAGQGRDLPRLAAAHVLPFDRSDEVLSAWLDTLSWTRQRAVFRVAGVDVRRRPELLARVLGDGHLVVAAPYSGRSAEGLTARQAEFEFAATQLALAAALGQEAVWADCGGGWDTASLRTRLEERGLHCIAPGAAVPSGGRAGSPAAAALALMAALPGDAGVPQAPVAPSVLPAQTSHRWIARLLWQVLGLLEMLLQGAVIATLLLFAVSLARFCWVAYAMARRSLRKARMPTPVDDAALPPITVIVPAYNEQQVIVETVRSVLACEYPRPVQVIVVDDGSSDATLAVARRAFDGHPQVAVLSKPNGGKSSALNLGIEAADTPVVVCIDADTQLDRQALRLLCRHFADPRVGAVAGNPKVGNRCNLITRVQALEYVVVDSVERQALEGSNAITCITGALGAYRRALLLELGGYVADTLAEDTDMTLRILAGGARIAYEEDALAWTEAPETLRDFMKQRFRWMFGTVQAAIKHRSSLFDLQRGSFGLVAMPNLLLLQVGTGCLLLPWVDLVALLGLSWLLLGRWVGWMFPHLHDLLRLLEDHDMAFYGLFAATTAAAFAMAAVALRLDARERLRSLLWLLPMQCVLRVLLGITAYRCIARAWSGRPLGWGTLKRTGHVQPLSAAAVAGIS